MKCPYCNLEMVRVNLSDLPNWPYLLPSSGKDAATGKPHKCGVPLGTPNLLVDAYECPSCHLVQLKRYQES